MAKESKEPSKEAKDEDPKPLFKESSEYKAEDLDRADKSLKELGLKLLARENAIQEELKQGRVSKDKVDHELSHIRRQKLSVARQLKA